MPLPLCSSRDGSPLELPSQYRFRCPALPLFSTYLRASERQRVGSGDLPDARSAPHCVPPSQLQQETQASRCCLLLVSEDNLQLSCKVRAQSHCGAGRGTWVSERKNRVCPVTSPHRSAHQVIGDKVLEEEISFPVSPASVPCVGVCRSS